MQTVVEEGALALLPRPAEQRGATCVRDVGDDATEIEGDDA